MPQLTRRAAGSRVTGLSRFCAEIPHETGQSRVSNHLAPESLIFATSQSELPPKIANWHMNGNPHVRHCGQAHWALNNVTAATDSGLLEHSPAQIRCRGA